MNIFLIQDDFEAARVTVEENGEYEIEDVDPGVYSLIAAGKDGFAALSLELVKSDEKLGQATTSGFQYVSTAATPKKKVPALGIAIVTDPEDIQACKREAQAAFNLRQQMLNPPANQFANQPINQFTSPGQLGPGGNIVQAPTGIVQSGFPAGAMPAPTYAGGPYSSGFPGGGFSGGYTGGGYPGGPSFGGAPVSNFPGPRGLSAGSPNGRLGIIAGIALIAVGVSDLADNDSGVEPAPISPFRR